MANGPLGEGSVTSTHFSSGSSASDGFRPGCPLAVGSAAGEVDPIRFREAPMRVVLIEGDGIGPEVTAAACRVVAAAGVDIDWVRADAGLGAAERHGEPLPEQTLDLIRKHRVCLKGPCTTPVGKGFRSINVRLRQGLEDRKSVV